MFRNIKILYAEDESFIRENMIELLEFLSAKVIAVDNGNEAYLKYKQVKPDIIIADIEMEGLNGIELAKKIRESDSNVQIIITTAYTNTEYLLDAVELNIAKYLVKPVPLIEIEKALNKCLKNMIKEDNPKRFLNETDYYDLKLKQLIVNSQEVYLDFNERNFLELLIKTPDRVVSYEELENRIWQYGMSTSAVRSLVFNLRKKLPNDCIKNISKIGYKFTTKE